MSPTWQWRPATPADDAFLAALFRSSRPELALLPPGLAEHFLADQQRLQEAGYRAAWPTAQSLIVEADGMPAGRMVIAEQARELRVVDLALAPEWRGRGGAKAVLASIQHKAMAGRRDVVLSVANDNAAAFRLYLSLGFVEESRDEVRAALRWRGEAGAQ